MRRVRGPDGPRRVGESMARLLGRLGAPPAPSTMEAVFARWDEVVGDEVAAHLRPVRIDGSVLVVAADHPAWATRARMESSRILAQLRPRCASPIERIEVVVDRS